MKITDIQPENVYKKPSLCCAMYRIIVDDALVIHRVKVMKGKDGYYVVFPYVGCTYKDGKKHFQDAVHPRTEELREQMSKEIIAAYEQSL